ncbi:MAG: hypothetical protein ABUT20_35395 [Bacteroidota bacterium]
MFNAVSWSNYLAFITSALLLYYTIVLSVFFRKDIQKLLQGKSGLNEVAPQNDPEVENENLKESNHNI